MLINCLHFSYIFHFDILFLEIYNSNFLFNYKIKNSKSNQLFLCIYDIVCICWNAIISSLGMHKNSFKYIYIVQENRMGLVKIKSKSNVVLISKLVLTYLSFDFCLIKRNWRVTTIFKKFSFHTINLLCNQKNNEDQNLVGSEFCFFFC